MIPGLKEKTAETIAAIRGRTALEPEVGLVLGSGLGGLGDGIGKIDGSVDPRGPDAPCTIGYGELPYFLRSTVPEAVGARHCGMRVLALSCITNMAAGILDKPLSVEEAAGTAGRVEERFGRLVTEIIKNI